jgi:tetratricopeptide (TPR) repeat protein
MDSETGSHDLGKIRDLLVDKFANRPGAIRTFCQDAPWLKGVLPYLGHKYDLYEMVAAVVDYCQARMLLDELVERAESFVLQPEAWPAGPQPYRPPPPPEPTHLPEPGPLPPGSRLPFDRNILFTGREAALHALAGTILYGPLSDPDLDTEDRSTLVTQTIEGMGGIGKTQLAVEFAYRYGRYFRGVYWLNCAHGEALDAEVAACGEQMRLRPWPATQPQQVECTLQAWWAASARAPGVLVILDNLEDVAVARQWLRRLRQVQARLLVTARRRRWPRDLGLVPLKLRIFNQRESVHFLRQYLPVGTATNVDLKDLAKRLGQLPLALELAGRYLEGPPSLGVASYLERLDQVLAHVSMRDWEKALGSPTGHDLDLARSFALSWELVDEAEAQRVFLAAGHCAAHQPIPYGLVGLAAGLDENSSARAVARLAGLGLLELDDPAAGPSIHPLLAEYARILPVTAGTDPQDALRSVTMVLAALAKKANESALPTEFAPYRPHLEAVAPRAEAAALEDAGALWNELGSHLKAVADYQGALVVLRRALALWQEAYGPESPRVAAAHNNLGGVQRALGEYDAARRAYERALAIDEANYGPDHPSVAIKVNNLGLALHALGNYAGARAKLERALAIWTSTLGEDARQVAVVSSNLGMVLFDLGDLVGAEAAFRRALTIDQKVYGPDHPDVARDVNNLASVLLAEGDASGARAAYERALSIDERVFGARHPKVALRYNNLGSVLQGLGEFDAAREAYEHALSIRQRIYGRRHPDTARSLWWLGFLEREAGRQDQARLHLSEAHSILVQFLPADHPELEKLRRHLGAIGIQATTGSES